MRLPGVNVPAVHAVATPCFMVLLACSMQNKLRARRPRHGLPNAANQMARRYALAQSAQRSSSSTSVRNATVCVLKKVLFLLFQTACPWCQAQPCLPGCLPATPEAPWRPPHIMQCRL